jgi:hypothetical protein
LTVLWIGPPEFEGHGELSPDNGPYYLTIDADGIDPTIMPAVWRIASPLTISRAEVDLSLGIMDEAFASTR